ncbi:MAG: 1,4-beta-xylanase [Verrucomicrobiales bacterium]|nr:1,4-beta-xylanase [Verrucomicrobiales bacterium]|tara:strand:+ start:158 stop:1114 length:957 start_codon:yes stop_codon:yes gene_type:complete
MQTLAFILSALALLSGPRTSLHADKKPSSKAKNKSAEKHDKKKKKKPELFKWVNPPKGELPKGVLHQTFKSPSMNVDIGYCIYLPPSYESQTNRRFPVVYYLHGGRPGSELKSIKLVKFIRAAHEEKKVGESIYVFVNGGEVSHYNMPQLGSWGEWAIVEELIPHVDAKYRTIPKRTARGIEGFSQGGRGTARIMFKYPDVFISGAPGGGGHETERKNSESGGWENEKLKFLKDANTYDRARAYARHKSPRIHILAYVGDKGFNYENNLAYSEFLKSLDIPHRLLVVPDAKHSAQEVYEAEAPQIMQFHMNNFEKGKK